MLCLTVQLPVPHPMRSLDQTVVSSHLVTALNNTVAPTHQSLDTTPALAPQPKPHTSPQSISPAHQTTTGEPIPTLAALLHAAIERQKQYPASAQEQEREGRATLAFTLLPNGDVKNLHIQHTSGTASLDQAALAAINAAVPFQDVARYLTTAENYQLDVVFALT